VYKVTWITRFRSGTERAAARDHWTEVYGALCRVVPGIERYVQSHAIAALDSLGVSDIIEPAFDGYSSCWYANREAFHGSLRTSEWHALGEVSPQAFSRDSFWGMSAAVEEQTIVEGPSSPFKAVWIVRFNEEIRGNAARTRQAHEYWTSVHGRSFGRAVPGVDRYVQNHVLEAVGPEGAMSEIQLEFDGFSECWFRDRAAFELAMASPEWAAMNRDAESLFDLKWAATGMRAVLEERVVKDGRQLAGLER
jgi:hypothetical protein